MLSLTHCVSEELKVSPGKCSMIDRPKGISSVRDTRCLVLYEGGLS